MNVRKNRCFQIIVLIVFLFSFPSFPSAHAYIIKSTPSENEILEQSPRKVSIRFDETIQPVFHSIQVYDSKGKRVDQKNGHIDPNNSSIIENGLNQNLPNGTYRIQWKVVSSDGHPVQGVIPFQIGTGNENKVASIAAQESKGYTPQLDLIIIRWFQFISNACYVGLVFFFLLVLPKEMEQDLYIKNIFNRLMKYSFILLCISIILSLPLQATIETTTSWSAVLNVRTLEEMLTNTQFGKIWVIQLDCLFFLSILTYLLSGNRFNKSLLMWVTFVLGIGLLLTKSFTGHAASSTNQLLTIGMDFLHLLSASIWMGSLIVLLSLIPLSRKIETKKSYMEMIRRFSKWGIALVLVLSITGVFGSFLYIPNLRSLLFTEYGRVLSGKVLLLVIMVIFAAVNLLKGKHNSENGLASSLWGELTTGFIVLILSVILTNLPTAMASPGPTNETKTVGNETRVTLHVTPNTIGENSYEILLNDRNGQTTKGIDQVTLTFKSLEMNMGEDTITLSKVKEGKYKAKGMNFNMSGRWNVHVHVLKRNLETVDTDIECIVGSQ